MSLSFGSYAALRAYTTPYSAPVFADVINTNLADPGPRMSLWFDASDTTTADNGIDIFVDTENQRWKLCFEDIYHQQWLETVDLTRLNDTIARVSLLGGGVVELPYDMDCDGTIIPKSDVTLRGRNDMTTLTCTSSTDLTKFVDEANGVKGWRVESIDFDANDKLKAGGAVYWTAGQNSEFVDCEFRNAGTNGPGDDYGVALRPGAVATKFTRCGFRDAATLLFNYHGISDVVVDGCTFSQWIAWGIRWFSRENNEINKTTIRNCRWNPPVSSGGTIKQPLAFQSDEVGFHRDVIVENNTLYLGNTPYELNDPSQNNGSADALSFHRCARLFIHGNYVFGSGEVGINVSNGCRDFSINGNYCYSCDTTGINVGGIETCYRGDVSNNTCQDCSRDQAVDHTNIGGIMAQDTVDLSIGNNVVDSNRTGAEQMPYGIVIYGDITRLRDLETNRIQRFTNQRIYIVTGSVVTLTGKHKWRAEVATDGSLGHTHNIGSVSKTGTGVYELSLDYQPPTNAGHVVSCESTTSLRLGQASLSGSVLTVYTFDASGAAADSKFTAEINYDD